MVYMRKSGLSTGNKAGRFLMYLLFLSVLRNTTDLAPAPGSNVPVNIYALSTPILCPISGVLAYPTESSTSGCSTVVLPKFDGHGGGPPS